MPIDRIAAKARAKELIRTAQPRVLAVSSLLLALLALLSFLSNQLVGYTTEEMERYIQYYNSGDMQRAVEYLAAHNPGGFEQLLNLLLSFAEAILSLGFLIFLLNTLRGSGAAIGNLLDGFAMWWKLLLLNLLAGLLIFLWSLLLIVPGFVAAYRYSMAQYVLIARPELGVIDCLRESKRLTQGRKGELFVMDLSFLGWWLLCAVPLLGWLLVIWVRPYYSLSMLQVYEDLSGYAPAQPTEAAL